MWKGDSEQCDEQMGWRVRQNERKGGRESKAEGKERRKVRQKERGRK